MSAKLAGTRSGPDAGQLYFFQQGTRFLIDGKAGERWRVRLAGAEEAWIDEKNVQLLPEGTPPPKALLETIVVRSSDSHADVEFTVGAPVPAVVSQEDGIVKVSFYGTREHVNWIVYDDNDSFVREVRWRQENSDKAEAFIHLKKGERLWGYSLRRTGERYVLPCAAPLARAAATSSKASPGLDPATAPTRGHRPASTREQDVNLSLACV